MGTGRRLRAFTFESRGRRRGEGSMGARRAERVGRLDELLLWEKQCLELKARSGARVARKNGMLRAWRTLSIEVYGERR